MIVSDLEIAIAFQSFASFFDLKLKRQSLLSSGLRQTEQDTSYLYSFWLKSVHPNCIYKLYIQGKGPEKRYSSSIPNFSKICSYLCFRCSHFYQNNSRFTSIDALSDLCCREYIVNICERIMLQIYDNLIYMMLLYLSFNFQQLLQWLRFFFFSCQRVGCGGKYLPIITCSAFCTRHCYLYFYDYETCISLFM